MRNIDSSLDKEALEFLWKYADIVMQKYQTAQHSARYAASL